MDAGIAYLNTVKENFRSVKRNAECAIGQLGFEELQYAPNEESNSIAVIVKHMSGNMLSRWTDFLTSDGEKSWRERDCEFTDSYASQSELLRAWESGWDTLFGALDSLSAEDLTTTVYIRSQPHQVIQAIERQVSHLSYHVGQIVYVAKLIRNTDWQTLSIARGKSETFLHEMEDRYGTKKGD